MCDSGFLEAEDLYGGMGVGKNCGPCNLIFTIKSRARGLKWGTKGPNLCDSGSLGKDAVDLCGGVGINMNSGKQRGNHHHLRDCSVGVGSENPINESALG